MKNLALGLWMALLFTDCTSSHSSNAEKPNILLIIADDASFNSMGIYGSKYVNTPNFDQIAREGVLFMNAFSNNPKCAPARSSLLTGRYSWQLEEAVVHRPLMPEKWRFYPELLKENGYFVGFTGKGWGPGLWKRGEHNPAGKGYQEASLKPPYSGINKNDYPENFRSFLNSTQNSDPFCFWLGTFEPHRGYEKDAYMKANRALKDVELQQFYPDNDIIRGDMLDYALEVEWFDKQIGEVIQILEEMGELENTVIMVTSDLGKERHDIGRDDGDQIAVGYPVRAIRTQEYLYSKNYEPQRWPAGNPEHGYKNSDDGPSEDYLISVSKDTLHPEYKYYELSFSFRPSEELFDVMNDPDCIQNLADDPGYQEKKVQLSKQMEEELIRQKDPRALGNGDVFDSYYYMGFEAMKKMYGERFEIPDHLKKYASISNGKVDE